MTLNIDKIPAYTPTDYINNSEPDLDADHLNKTEQALKRVTAAANEAIEALKSLNTAKIDTAKIVNNLLSTDPTTVLSGLMGKKLQDQLTQLNGELPRKLGFIGSTKDNFWIYLDHSTKRLFFYDAPYQEPGNPHIIGTLTLT